jgi:hypothetical protein
MTYHRDTRVRRVNASSHDYRLTKPIQYDNKNGENVGDDNDRSNPSRTGQHESQRTELLSTIL